MEGLMFNTCVLIFVKINLHNLSFSVCLIDLVVILRIEFCIGKAAKVFSKGLQKQPIETYGIYGTYNDIKKDK